LLTDGEVSSFEKVTKWLEEKQKSKNIRLFPVGVGFAVSQSNIRALANAGGGISSFCIPGEDVPMKISNQLKHIFCSLEKLDFRFNFDKSPLSAPVKFNPVTAGDRVLVYALLEEDLKGTVTLSGTLQDGKPYEIKLTCDVSNGFRLGKMIHRLAARAIIKDLQDKNSPEDSVLPLATTFCLASKYTSFVAVEERTEAEKEKIKQEHAQKMVQKMEIEGSKSKRDGDKKMETKVRYSKRRRFVLQNQAEGPRTFCAHRCEKCSSRVY